MHSHMGRSSKLVNYRVSPTSYRYFETVLRYSVYPSLVPLRCDVGDNKDNTERKSSVARWLFHGYYKLIQKWRPSFVKRCAPLPEVKKKLFLAVTPSEARRSRWKERNKIVYPNDRTKIDSKSVTWVLILSMFGWCFVLMKSKLCSSRIQTLSLWNPNFVLLESQLRKYTNIVESVTVHSTSLPVVHITGTLSE